MLSDQHYEQLCRQVQLKDASCIATLYDSYGNALYGVILRIVQNEEVANELLQDTFTKIWSKGDSFNPRWEIIHMDDEDCAKCGLKLYRIKACQRSAKHPGR